MNTLWNVWCICLIVTLAVYATSYSDCEAGWEKFQDKSCFIVVNHTAKGTKAARQRCIKMGADLVTIRSPEESAFMLSLFHGEMPENIYIGLGSKGNGANYMWIDGSVTTWTNWHPNVDPNPTSSEPCVTLSAPILVPGWGMIGDPADTGKWLRVHCEHMITTVLCEKQIGKVMTVEKNDRNFYRQRGRYLHNNDINSVTVAWIIECLRHCLLTATCLSANIKTDDMSSTDNCILNDATSWEAIEWMRNASYDGIDPIQWDFYETQHPGV